MERHVDQIHAHTLLFFFVKAGHIDTDWRRDPGTMDGDEFIHGNEDGETTRKQKGRKLSHGKKKDCFLFKINIFWLAWDLQLSVFRIQEERLIDLKFPLTLREVFFQFIIVKKENNGVFMFRVSSII